VALRQHQQLDEQALFAGWLLPITPEKVLFDEALD
jgi:hypothetical protein